MAALAGEHAATESASCSSTRGVERAGGRVVRASVEVAPGVVVSDVAATEGNGFTLSQR